MAEITINIGLGQDSQSDSKSAYPGGSASNPSACVILVPVECNKPIDGKIKCIYCSTDPQAIKKAEELSQKLNSPLEYKTKKLLYWDIGDLIDEPDSTKVAQLPFYIDWSPEEKVRNGESFNEFKKRFLGELESIMEEAKKENAFILVVTHNDCCKLAYAWMEEKEDEAESEEDDEFYTVDREEFLGKGFKDPFPIRIEQDGSGWTCEELDEEISEEENGKDAEG